MKRITLATAAIALLALSGAGHAAIVTYDFSVTAASGSLNGSTGSGYFSYDDAIVPVGGGPVYGTALLTDLNFVWGGVTFTEATANTGGLTFAASGDFTAFVFGTNCGPGSCLLSSTTVGWAVQYIGNVVSSFVYSDGTAISSGSLTFARREVPEPATLALLGLGLGLAGAGFGVSRRRRGI